MVPKTTRRRRAPTMGQASSQVNPQSQEQGVALSANASRNEVGDERLVRNGISSALEHERTEEESATALLLLKNSRLRTPPTAQDDLDASAQLLRESSPLRPFNTSSNTSDHADVVLDELVSRKRKRGNKRSKRRHNVLEPTTDGGNSKHSEARMNKKPPVDSYGSTPPTLNLDDINENEEDVASLFQEYETQSRSPIADLPHHDDDPFVPSNEDIVDLTKTAQAYIEAQAVSGRGKKRKRKHARRERAEDFDTSAEQEFLDSTGQHAFDVDFAALDEIIASHGMQFANPFDEEPGLGLPNGAESHDSELFLPPTDVVETRISTEAAPSQQSGLDIRQVPGEQRPRKRRRMEAPNSVDSHAQDYVSPYAPKDVSQDQVLQGYEDNQHQASSEIPYSQQAPRANNSHQSVESTSQEEASLHSEQPSKSRGNKKQRGDQEKKPYQPPVQEIAAMGGMFTESEVRILDSFRDRYCREEQTSDRRFNELIQANLRRDPEANRLFASIYEELPHRTRQSIARFCRRHFHNFSARGTWTGSDDERLKDAVIEKGRSWKAVGEAIGRFPEDVRDRYRNYHVNADKRNKEAWTHEEVRALVKAVSICMSVIAQQRRAAKEDLYSGREIPESEPESDQEIEDMKLINWQVVSERMGGTRSRLQCSYKWNHLKNSDRRKYLKEVRRAMKGRLPKRKRDGPWRLKRAIKKLRNMETGDKYDFLQALSNCNASGEGNIPWKLIGDKEFRSRWSTIDVKAALEIFKREVPGSESMHYQDVINCVYTRLMAEHASDFETQRDPKAYADVNRENRNTRKAKAERSRTRLGKLETLEERRIRRERAKYGEPPKVKSSLFVGPSDDEAEDPGSNPGRDEETEDKYHDRRRVDRDSEVVESTNGSRNGDTAPEDSATEDSDVGRNPSRTSSTSVDNQYDGEATAKGARVRDRESSPEYSDDGLFVDDEYNNLDLANRLQLLRDA